MSGHIQLHATCVGIDGRGLLLLGESGSGKSDVALRLIYGGAVLVADDRVDIINDNQELVASPPERLRGILEARGIGILHLPRVEKMPLMLAVNLVPREEVERLPEDKFFDCLGLRLPLVSLHAFDGSTCAKIRLFLASFPS